MDDEKYKTLLAAIQNSKHEVEQKVTASLEKLKREVTEGQERSSLELASKINKSTYQFRRKGNEAQFQFNTSVEDSISSARKEITQVAPVTDKQRIH